MLVWRSSLFARENIHGLLPLLLGEKSPLLGRLSDLKSREPLCLASLSFRRFSSGVVEISLCRREISCCFPELLSRSGHFFLDRRSLAFCVREISFVVIFALRDFVPEFTTLLSEVIELPPVDRCPLFDDRQFELVGNCLSADVGLRFEVRLRHLIGSTSNDQGIGKRPQHDVLPFAPFLLWLAARREPSVASISTCLFSPSPLG